MDQMMDFGKIQSLKLSINLFLKTNPRPKKGPLPLENLTLLHVAAYFDYLETFVFLESKGFPLNVKSAAQYSPIHYACLNGSLEVCTYILKKDPDEAKILSEVDI